MSPRALGRTFSFDNDDESSLHANRSDKINPFGGMASPPAYTDSPARRTYSDSPPPPPAHTSSTAYQIPRPTIVQPPRPHIQVNTRKVQYGAYRSPDLDHSASNRTASTITPGADNLGERAVGGGIAGIAMGVAHTDEHGSGVEALRSPRESPQADRGLPPEPYNTIPNLHPHMRDPYASPAPSGDPFDDQRGSPTPSPGDITPRGNPSSHSIPMSEYPFRDVYGNGRSSFTDNPYQRFSTAWDPRVARGDIDPDDIEDDGDDFMEPPLRPRRSVLGLKNSPRNSVPEGAVVGAGGAAAATAGILGTLGSLVGKNNAVSSGTRDPSGQYGAVPGSSGSGFDNNGVEKSEWLSKQASGRKRLRWIMGISIALALIGGIVGGVIGGLLNNSSSSSSSSSDSTVAADDSALDLNSPAIKKLMNNAHLHRVFPAMDYTPFNAQYPACLTNPPSQDNVTMDVAVLSQLTNVVRLYGTDCNQTEMVLSAIDKLALTDMKVWLGVWIDKNSTTNNRGLDAMYNILSKYGADPFKGVIVGNEVLYRNDSTEAQLGDILSAVKTNLTNQNIDLDVATSDLGDNWASSLVDNVDIVMSNIHPFFAGVTAEVAAGWTWDFWQQLDTVLTNNDRKQHIISETGWPSAGGTNCGQANTCGSVAGIDEMNTFMDTFICQSLANGTNFFWFEAFDEPWKESFNEPGKEWEDKWGLMDPGRKLKPGLIIPDCGGKTVS